MFFVTGLMTFPTFAIFHFLFFFFRDDIAMSARSGTEVSRTLLAHFLVPHTLLARVLVPRRLLAHVQVPRTMLDEDV